VILAALGLGFLGGAFHLLVTAFRARVVTRGSLGLSVVVVPLGLAGPLLAVYAVLLASPAHIWAVLVGLIAARWILVDRVGRALEEGSWTR
jgi:hypothetical protein